MEIPVLVEPLPEGRYRARTGEPFGLVVEGASRQEALKQLEVQIRGRLESGAELLTLVVPPPSSPSAMPAEMEKHPFTDAWLEAMAENRALEDAETP